MEDIDSNATTVSYTACEGQCLSELEVLPEGWGVHIDFPTFQEGTCPSAVPTSYGDLATMASARDRLRRRIQASARDTVDMGAPWRRWQELVSVVSLLTIPGDLGWGTEEGRLPPSRNVARTARTERSLPDPFRHPSGEDAVFPILDTGVFEESSRSERQV